MIRPQSIPRPLTYHWAVFSVGCLLAIAPSLAAQEPSGQRAAEASGVAEVPSGEAEVDPAVLAMIENVEQSILDWYDTLGKMRALQIRYHNGTGANDRQYRREFRELEAKSRLQHDVALQAAVALTREQPEGIPGVWEFLIKSVNLRGGFDWYEGVAPAAQAIQELKRSGGSLTVEFPRLDSFHGRALVTEAEWEQAREVLQRALQSEEPSETDFRLLTLLETLPEQWEREQELRRAEAEADDLPRVLLETTRGNVVVELFEDQAPNTVANFIELVEQGFYDQLPFTTVIDNLFAATGDPIGDGSGDAGYRIADESDHPDARGAFRGSLFMAKIPDSSGEPGLTLADTASSQFMITYLPVPTDRGEFTVFGRVIEGMPHVSLLTRVDPNEKKEKTARALPPDRLISAKVLRKRDHDYKVERIEYREQVR